MSDVPERVQQGRTMNRSFAAILGLFVVVQLGYVVWLTGYRAGYDDGASKAWDDARGALMPREGSELTRLDPAAYSEFAER